MAFSKEEFIEGFVSETQEHIDAINNGIIQYKATPGNKELLSAILRELHTIKGTSRMMGYPVIESLSHGLEDVFKGIREEKYELNDHIVQLTFHTSDCIQRVLRKIVEEGNDELNISEYMETFKKASSGLFFTTDNLNIDLNDSDDDEVFELEEKDDTLENITSIRIDINRINEIIRSFDNLIIRQFRFKHQLEEFEARLNATEGNVIHELPKQLKEDLLQTETAIFDTQHQLLNLRMLPLDMVLTPLKKEVESDSLKLKKNIELDIPKTEFLLDKAILENLKGILLHLIRNSMDHGIETPEERKAIGKTDRGHISVFAQQNSNHIIIYVIDDGRGIQYEQVRKKAIELFPNDQKEIENMSHKELEQYLYVSGLSTKEQTTELSGRGVGLDVVRTDMEKIKGRIKIKSKENEGTTFELKIPLSLATQQGLFVHTGNMKLMIPSNYIAEIANVEERDITIIQGQSYISLHNMLIPLYFLSSIIGGEQNENTSSVIVVEYLETQIAIVADSIDQYETVVVNPLPPVMQKLEAVQGVVYDENYAIIPILNIPDIMRRLRRLLAYDMRKYEIKNKKHTFTVLVIDDSATTRQIEKAIFETDGYIVETAVDGIDALDILKTKHVDAIITDIKMPRMDGITFLSNLRRTPEFDNTPVIIVSGVYDPETKEKFMNAGAQSFIVKSEFQRGNLLQAVKELLGE
ncbi:MAG: response regulator [Treponema sp.]|nr:response regulator [Treponema sp.]MBR7079006.1 response regulator [Treponema sp.]